jgi:hypothetical protein
MREGPDWCQLALNNNEAEARERLEETYHASVLAELVDELDRLHHGLAELDVCEAARMRVLELSSASLNRGQLTIERKTMNAHSESV